MVARKARLAPAACRPASTSNQGPCVSTNSIITARSIPVNQAMLLIFRSFYSTFGSGGEAGRLFVDQEVYGGNRPRGLTCSLDEWTKAAHPPKLPTHIAYISDHGSVRDQGAMFRIHSREGILEAERVPRLISAIHTLAIATSAANERVLVISCAGAFLPEASRSSRPGTVT